MTEGRKDRIARLRSLACAFRQKRGSKSDNEGKSDGDTEKWHDRADGDEAHWPQNNAPPKKTRAQQRNRAFGDRMTGIRNVLHKIGERRKQDLFNRMSKTHVDGDEVEVTITGNEKKLRKYDNIPINIANQENLSTVEGNDRNGLDSIQRDVPVKLEKKNSIESSVSDKQRPHEVEVAITSYKDGKDTASNEEEENDVKRIARSASAAVSVAESLLKEEPGWLTPSSSRLSGRGSQLSKQTSRVRIVVEDYGSVDDRSTQTEQATNGRREKKTENRPPRHSGPRTKDSASMSCAEEESQAVSEGFDPVKARVQLAILNERIARMESDVVSEEKSVSLHTHELSHRSMDKHYLDARDNDSIIDTSPSRSVQQVASDASAAATEPSTESEYSPERKQVDPGKKTSFRESKLSIVSKSTSSRRPPRSDESRVSFGSRPEEARRAQSKKTSKSKNKNKTRKSKDATKRKNLRLPYASGLTGMNGGHDSELERIVMEDMLSFVDPDDYDALSDEQDGFTRDIFVDDDVNTQDLMNYYDEGSEGVIADDLRTQEMEYCCTCDL